MLIVVDIFFGKGENVSLLFFFLLSVFQHKKSLRFYETEIIFSLCKGSDDMNFISLCNNIFMFFFFCFVVVFLRRRLVRRRKTHR